MTEPGATNYARKASLMRALEVPELYSSQVLTVRYRVLVTSCYAKGTCTWRTTAHSYGSFSASVLSRGAASSCLPGAHQIANPPRTLRPLTAGNK